MHLQSYKHTTVTAANVQFSNTENWKSLIQTKPLKYIAKCKF